MSSTRTTKTVGFSVPPSLEKEVQKIAKEERRTKSELFREMLRVYRYYRKQRDHKEEMLIDRLVELAIREAREAPPMSEEEAEKLDTELMEYGEKQAKKSGIREEDVDRIIYEERQRRKKKQDRA